MTSNQVNFLKNYSRDKGDGKPAASSVHYIFHDEVCFRSENEFIIFDDTNQFVHCISSNQDSTVKQGCPYAINSASYESLMYAQANVTIEDLKYILNNVMNGLVTNEQKEMILEWARNMPSNPISPVIGSYMKQPAPKANYKPITEKNTFRSDGITNNKYPVDEDGVVVNPDGYRVPEE